MLRKGRLQSISRGIQIVILLLRGAREIDCNRPFLSILSYSDSDDGTIVHLDTKAAIAQMLYSGAYAFLGIAPDKVHIAGHRLQSITMDKVQQTDFASCIGRRLRL